MIKKEKRKQIVEVTKDILCNRCGASCSTGNCGCFSCAILTATWGYGSHRDGQEHEAHLCEKCWEKITKDFKYPDLISENNFLRS